MPACITIVLRLPHAFNIVTRAEVANLGQRLLNSQLLFLLRFIFDRCSCGC